MPERLTPAQDADREKRWAAGSSVVAAVALTGLKLAIGLVTRSLGILAEAAHSGLDLVAALLTFFAVRISGKPADHNHLYGHGKIENLSALAETFLLLATCLWIIYGAVDRMVSKTVDIEVNIWSFTVMVTSIVVDVSRSRVLYRAARKYNSQALEADALHFSTDIWSSGVVILGLGGVKLSDWMPAWEFLHYADAVAALLVALIVVQVGSKLGLRTVRGLLDTAPAGLADRIMAAVEAHPAVTNCHNVRLRASGAQHFIDVHIVVNGNLTLRQAHDLTEEIEGVIQQLVPGADVTVHPEPAPETLAGE